MNNKRIVLLLFFGIAFSVASFYAGCFIGKKQNNDLTSLLDNMPEVGELMYAVKLMQENAAQNTQLEINQFAEASNRLAKLNLFLSVSGHIKRYPERANEILKDYRTWLAYYTKTMGNFHEYEGGSMAPMAYSNHSSLLNDLRSKYETASPEQQKAFREMRNFSFICNASEVNLVHGYGEIPLEGEPNKDHYMLLPESCKRYALNNEVCHSGVLKTYVNGFEKLIKGTWKNGKFISAEGITQPNKSDEMLSSKGSP